MRYERLIDEELRRLYVYEGRNCPEIARSIGCSLANVRLWLAAAGIPRRSPGSRLQSNPRVTHGHTRNGHNSPTYMSWLAMRNRCRNPRNVKYPMYGGRGITVCDRWFDSFEDFLEDMGERPPGMTLDRHPNKNGNYEPGNVRWATSKQQGQNSNLAGKGWRRSNTHCPSGHEFTPENTRLRNGYRKCRACESQRARAKRAAA